MAKKTSSPDPQKANRIALRRLKRKNESLRATIDEVFGMLVSGATATSKEALRGTISNACRFIMVDLPDVYSELRPSEVSVFGKRIERKIAAEMGIDQAELPSASFNDQLLGWRKVLIKDYPEKLKEYTGNKPLPANLRSPILTQEQLEAWVQIEFHMWLGLASNLHKPCLVKVERDRYVKIMQKIVEPFPLKRGRHSTSRDADTYEALERKGKSEEFIRKKLTPDCYSNSMEKKIAGRKAFSKIKGRVDSRKRMRDVYAAKKRAKESEAQAGVSLSL